MNPKLIKISGYLGLFLLITGLSYFLFDKLMPANKSFLSTISNKIKKEEKASDGTPEVVSMYPGPKTQVCPLNGQKYTKEEDKQQNDNKRNH